MLNPKSLQSNLEHMLAIRRRIENVLEKAPEGTLFYQQQRQNAPIPYAAYRRDGKRIRRSLRNADPKYVQSLLFKKYAKKLKPFVEKNILSMEHALRYIPLSELGGDFQKELYRPCKDYFLGKAPENADFERLPERQNPFHPEELNIRTDLGVFRTREEYLTARSMNTLGLRFKYETPLAVGMYYRYPDFAVLHPRTGKIVYIEYAGKMHDQEYRKSLLKRIDEYANAGVYLGVNLFVIASAPGEGFDMEAVIDQLKGIFGI